MTESLKKFSTKEKALQLNLNQKIYGTIAEIGAGQEVASHFFRAGAASGTIAKTMSAYDMTFSDSIYGKTKRYVSEDKLIRMLDKEYSLLSQRLTQRAKKSHFFAFADTVETLNYAKTNDSHGWMGLRFQLHPQSDINDCVIHINLKDNEAAWQQQVLGIVGVNLIHSCFHLSNPEDIMTALIDNISTDRLEIDMFKLKGPDFHHVDNRLMTLKLVKNQLCGAAMFDPEGNVMQASQALYKKHVVVLRGRFRPVTHVNVDMMLSGVRAFKKEVDVTRGDMMIITELTLNDLTISGDIDETDFLDRVDCLCSLGQNVLISSYQEHYLLASYLHKFARRKRLAFIIGINNLKSIFEEKYYETLTGGILTAFSRLFRSNVNLYVYPSIGSDGLLVKSNDLKITGHLDHLFKYFLANDKIQDLKDVKKEHLSIISNEVLEMIKKEDKKWECMVPKRVVAMIKKNHMFNFPVKIKTDPNIDY